ncbi:MAG: hypothetical protein ACKVII_07595 [Planctomycetales bacterium]|jgi:hypothetical protein
MNQQYVIRRWLCASGVTVAGAILALQVSAQGVAPGSPPGQAVLQQGQFGFRNANSGAPGQPSGGAFDPSTEGRLNSAGLFNSGSGGSGKNIPDAGGANSVGNKPSDNSKINAAKLQKAIETLKRATSEEARKATLENLSQIVHEIFDEDLKKRESEVGDIRQRVSKLQALIDKRKESKDRIVDLQFKIQLNEVEGLGFAIKRSGRSQNLNAYIGGGLPGMGIATMMGESGVQHSQMRGASFGEDYAGGAAMNSSDDPRRKSEIVLQAATSKLKEATSEEERQAAGKLLRSALERYFATDLEMREREIKGIQERVTNLDKLIERRRQARDQVISLQLEVLKNEADGLGFFSTSSRRSSNGNGAFHVNVPGMNQSFIGFTR